MHSMMTESALLASHSTHMTGVRPKTGTSFIGSLFYLFKRFKESNDNQFSMAGLSFINRTGALMARCQSTADHTHRHQWRKDLTLEEHNYSLRLHSNQVINQTLGYYVYTNVLTIEEHIRHVFLFTFVFRQNLRLE